MELIRDPRYECGLLSIDGAEGMPDWSDFKRRIDFVRDVYDVNATFLEAFKSDDGASWNVPFFAVQEFDLGKKYVPHAVIERNTPYKVSMCKPLSPSSVDLETLNILARLSERDVPGTWIDEVVPKRRHASRENPGDVFEGLVGMKEQRLRLMKLAKAVAACGKESIDCFHLVFTGNPGTGKTETARRMAEYLDTLGVTDGTGRFVKAGEADIIGKYVGHTAPRVKKLVEQAMGGVLFIDEFYALAAADSFGQQAIDELTNQLDAHRHDLVCVVAGYKDEVEAALALNRGLRDRFGYHIDFPDFTDAELAEIFRRDVAKRGFAVGCEDSLARSISALRRGEGFSNARSVRRLVDQCVCEACWEHEGDKAIRPGDLEAALGQCVSRGRRGFVGFAA